MSLVTQSIGQWLDWTITWTGFSANPTAVTSRYTLIGKTCSCYVMATAGTSNATSFTITLPFPAANTSNQRNAARISDNSTFSTGQIVTTANSNIATINPSMASGTWTASNLKVVQFSFTYEIA